MEETSQGDEKEQWFPGNQVKKTLFTLIKL